MGTSLGPKYIPHTYMDLLGLCLQKGQGRVIFAFTIIATTTVDTKNPA